MHVMFTLSFAAALGVLLGCAKPPEVEREAKPGPASPPPAADPAAAPPGLDWGVLEWPLLTNHVQITSRDEFYKAGEAYFDHHTPPRWVIFQAVPVPPPGKEPEPFYAMYVAKLKRDAAGHITGTEAPIRISPDGSANTCGWFHPTEVGRVLFGSTVGSPASNEKSGFRVGTRKYVWMFPAEMDVVSRFVPELWDDHHAGAQHPQPYPTGGFDAAPMFSRSNYDAEGSWSSDGRFVLYAHVRDEPTRGRPDADIWIYDTKTGKQHEIVRGEGYDGGPFFSPDGRMICYRSDRRGDDLLQLFVGVLKFDADGVPVGLQSEHQITDDEHVNWAPYWHPSGKFLVYGSSGVGHSNYEVFAVEVDTGKPASQLRRRRVTFAHGADVLPVFSGDGRLMMWTAQRGPMARGETRPSSQLWIAEVNPAPGGFSDTGKMFDNLPDQRPEGEAAPSPAAHP
ncbi:MAG: TolB family protein [Phycisphaerales bacterium]